MGKGVAAAVGTIGLAMLVGVAVAVFLGGNGRDASETTENKGSPQAAVKAAPKQLKGKPLSEWAAALKGNDRAARRQAAAALITVDGEQAAALVPLLEGTLKDGDADARRLAKYVFNYFPATPEAIPALATMLRDEDKDKVRREAAAALVRIGRSDPKALTPVLKAAFADADPDVRQLAKYLQENVDPDGAHTGLKSTGPRVGRQVGQRAPEIEGTDLDGNRLQLSDYRGKVVVLDFWGNWCGPCRSTYPHNRSMVTRYRNKPFAFLGINAGDNLDVLKTLRSDGTLTWRIWRDQPKGHILAQWQIEAVPTIYVLDPRGVIRQRFPGVPDDRDLDELVDKLLAEPTPS